MKNQALIAVAALAVATAITLRSIAPANESTGIENAATRSPNASTEETHQTSLSSPSREVLATPAPSNANASAATNASIPATLPTPEGVDIEFRLKDVLFWQEVIENNRDVDRTDKELVRREMESLHHLISGILHAQGRTTLMTPHEEEVGGFIYSRDGYDHAFGAHMGFYRFNKGEFPAYDEIRSRFIAIELEQPLPPLSEGYLEGVQLIGHQAVEALSKLN